MVRQLDALDEGYRLYVVAGYRAGYPQNRGRAVEELDRMTVVHIIGVLLIVGVFGALFYRRTGGSHGSNPEQEGMPGLWSAGDQYSGGGGSDSD